LAENCGDGIWPVIARRGEYGANSSFRFLLDFVHVGIAGDDYREKPNMETTLATDIRTNPPLLMNERELAFVTGLCPRSVRNYTRAGFIPRIKIGRRVLYRWPQVEAALARLESGRISQ
jgi:hypothetical protein